MTENSAALRLAVLPVTPLQQNCSIVFEEATKRAAVTDPGGDIDRILGAIDQLGVTVERILITHGHFDHAGAATPLKAALEKKQGAPVPIEGPHLDDEFLLSRVPEAAARWGFTTGFAAVKPDRWLVDGDRVSVGGIAFEVIHCPGHSPGHVVYFQREARFAIVGDVIFAGSIGRTDLPRGDHATLLASINDKLLPLGDDVGFLPGHGPTSTFGQERAENPFLVED
jgi:glyoxylase-like metal-dependent hydrolase (beta-lactamase superfamily II)